VRTAEPAGSRGTRVGAIKDSDIPNPSHLSGVVRYRCVAAESSVPRWLLQYGQFSINIRLLDCSSIWGNSIHLPSLETAIAPIQPGAGFSNS